MRIQKIIHTWTPSFSFAFCSEKSRHAILALVIFFGIAETKFKLNSNPVNSLLEQTRSNTLRSNSTIQSITRNKYTLPSTFSMRFQHIHSLDRVKMTTFAIIYSNSHCSFDYHIREESIIPAVQLRKVRTESMKIRYNKEFAY